MVKTTIETPETLDWLLAQRREGGVPLALADESPSPGATALLALALLELGEPTLAIPSLDWLVSAQRRDGAWNEGGTEERGVLDSGLALEALAAALPHRRQVSAALKRGAAHLASAIESTGRLPLPENIGRWDLGSRGRLDESLQLRALVGLEAAGRVLGRDDWSRAGAEARDLYLKIPDLERFDRAHRPTQAFCFAVEGLWRLGEEARAREALASLAEAQTPSGEVPAFFDVGWTCASGLGQAAHLWALTGDETRARLALGALARHALPNGDIPARFGLVEGGRREGSSVVAAIHRLRAETRLADDQRREQDGPAEPVVATLRRSSDEDDPRTLARRVTEPAHSRGLEVVMETTQRGQAVLELGADTGEASARLARARREVTLVDGRAESLAIAREVFARLGLEGRFEVVPLTEALPFKDRSFDCVWARGLLACVAPETRAHLVREAARVSARRVLSIVPNARSLPQRLAAWDQERRRPGLTSAFGKGCATLRPEFEAAGLHCIHEYSIDPEGAIDALEGAAMTPIRNFFHAFLRGLDEEERGELDQGRLLVTLGERPRA